MERRLLFAHPQAEKFLKEALKNGAGERLIAKAQQDVVLARDLGAVAIYLSENVNPTEVGARLHPPVSRTTARKMIRRGIGAIWSEADQATQEEYPLDEIPLKTAGKLKTTTLALAQAAFKGLSYPQILAETGLNVNEVASRRNTLMTRGIEVPSRYRTREESAAIIKAATDPTLPREDYLKIAMGLSRGTVQHFTVRFGAFLSLTNALAEIKYYVGPKIIGPIKDFLVAEGLVLHFKKVVQSGENAGQEQHYYYVPRRDLELIASRLAEEPSLDRYKKNVVRQLGGPEARIHASTNDFSHSTDDFERISKVFHPRGLTDGAKRPVVPYDIFFNTPDCPASVYEYDGNVIYFKEQKAEMEEFVDKRRQELGI